MTPTQFNPADRFLHYCRVARLDKPIGTMLLVWPTLWALWLAADGHPDGAILFIFIAGTVLMRSAGCVMNDIADRHFDGHVERTRERPLAAGAITVAEALLVAAFLVILAFVLVLRLNKLTVWLSVVALILSASYPLTKRFLSIPQAYLGIAFGFGIPMGFAAIQNTVPLAGWLMLLANVFWSVAYDTEYAMVDRPDDLKIGIRSSAITFGRFDVSAIMICYAATLGLLALVGVLCQRGVLFYLGLCIAALIVLYHYRLIAQRDRAKCFKAFMHNNWLGAVIFIGLALDYLFLL